MRNWAILALLSLVAAAVCACETVSGSAAPLTRRGFSPTKEAVYVHTVTPAPSELAMLGLVSARGVGNEATVDQVIPELIHQAQRLGATHLVIDDLHMEYHWYTSLTTYSYRCGFGWCTDASPASHEVATLVARGRGFGPGATKP